MRREREGGVGMRRKRKTMRRTRGEGKGDGVCVATEEKTGNMGRTMREGGGGEGGRTREARRNITEEEMTRIRRHGCFRAFGVSRRFLDVSGGAEHAKNVQEHWRPSSTKGAKKGAQRKRSMTRVRRHGCLRAFGAPWKPREISGSPEQAKHVGNMCVPDSPLQYGMANRAEVFRAGQWPCS